MLNFCRYPFTSSVSNENVEDMSTHTCYDIAMRELNAHSKLRTILLLLIVKVEYIDLKIVKLSSRINTHERQQHQLFSKFTPVHFRIKCYMT